MEPLKRKSKHAASYRQQRGRGGCTSVFSAGRMIFSGAALGLISGLATERDGIFLASVSEIPTYRQKYRSLTVDDTL